MEMKPTLNIAIKTITCLALVLASPAISSAAIFIGNLSSADDVIQVTFNLPIPASVNIQTYQFGGNGSVSPGGIDSVVSLFFGNNANATMVAYNDDGDCPPAAVNPFCGDSTLQFVALASGNYIIAITANQNLPIGPTLGSGFTGAMGTLDGTNYYLDLQIGSLVPEPATFVLAFCGFALILGKRKTIGRSVPGMLVLIAAGTTMAADIFVPSGGDLQAALDAAQFGDTVTLQAGSVFTGSFMARPKTGTGLITIQTSSTELRSRVGVRVGPADASKMAAIVTPSSLAGIDFSFGGSHYKMIGIEVRPAPGIYVFDLVRIGTFETQVSQLPSDIEIDRCYIHGDPIVGGKRGVALNGIGVTIQNSYFEQFFDLFQETYAIGGWTGPGPYRILNNHLEAAGVIILFGGVVPNFPGVLPSDIEVRQNHFFKPLSWNPNHPSFTGKAYLSKFHYEMKFGRRAIVDGNIFENSWHPPVAGRAIVLGVRTEGNAVSNAVVEDVQITRNILKNLGAGILIFGRDGLSGNTGALRRVRVENNLFMDILESNSLAGFDTAGVLATVHSEAEDVQILHNTYIGQGRNIFFHFLQLGQGYRVENNLLQHNQQGISWSESLFDIDALNAAAPLGYTFFGNAIQGGTAARFPTGNFFPPTLNDIGYANLALGDLRLRPSSPYWRAATDGKDIGADAAAVYQATQGVVPGGTGIPLASPRCVTGVTPASSTFDRNGGVANLTVTAPGTCFWMTGISPGWLNLVSGFSGSGSGTVSYTVPAYIGTTARTTSLVVGGVKVTIRQNH